MKRFRIALFASAVAIGLISNTTLALAIQIGPRIACCKHGLEVGNIPNPAPAPGLPKTLNVNVTENLNAIGRAIAHPFEEIGKSIKDPWGYKKKAQEWIDGTKSFVASTWETVSKDTVRIVAMICGTLVICCAMFAFRPRKAVLATTRTK